MKRSNRNILVCTSVVLLVGCISLAISAIATAEIYKWVDEDGVVHYSDNPPQDAESETVQLRSTTPPAGSSEALKRQLEQSEKASERRAEKRRAASAAKKSKKAARGAQDSRCFMARVRLAVLQEQLPVYRDKQGQFRVHRDGDPYSGKREYIDDATRASEVARAHQEIKSSCQDPDSTREQNVARATWIRSEKCTSARADLEQLENRDQTWSKDGLERLRNRVNRYCGK